MCVCDCMCIWYIYSIWRLACIYVKHFQHTSALICKHPVFDCMWPGFLHLLLLAFFTVSSLAPMESLVAFPSHCFCTSGTLQRSSSMLQPLPRDTSWTPTTWVWSLLSTMLWMKGPGKTLRRVPGVAILCFPLSIMLVKRNSGSQRDGTWRTWPSSTTLNYGVTNHTVRPCF